MRTQLAETDARRGTLEQELAVSVNARREAEAEHAAQLAVVEGRAAERLEAARRDANTALTARTTEFEKQAAERVEAAVRETRETAARARAETARRHEAALKTVRAQLADADTRRGTLEQELAVSVNARREATITLAAVQEAATELEKRAAERLEATVHETRDAAARAAAKTAQQHEATLETVRAHVEEADARRLTLEQEVVDHVNASREADANHAAQLAAMEVQTSARVEAAVRKTQDEAARAAAETAQQHEAALAAVRTLLENAGARRVTLEQEFAAHVNAGREAGANYAVQLSAVEERVEAACREGKAALATQTATRVKVATRKARVASTSGREARGQRQHDIPDVNVQFGAMREADGDTEVPPANGQQAMSMITGAVVLAGLTGALIGLYVAYSAILY